MELVLITRTEGNDAEVLRNAIQDWQQRYLAHPADFSVLQSFFDRILQITPHPEHIAVMLPLSGNFRAAGEAIRNGILASHYEQLDAEVELRFYDTAADPSGLGKSTRMPSLPAPRPVVGPLTKAEVNELARASAATLVSVLALNRAEGVSELPPGFMQFALAPERSQASRRRDQKPRTAARPGAHPRQCLG